MNVASYLHRKFYASVASRTAGATTLFQRSFPASIASKIQRADRLIFVCAGNVVRSAYAERKARQTLQNRAIAISSAGLWAHAGTAADIEASKVARTRGVDLSHHEAAPFTADMVTDSTIVFVMEPFHLSRIAMLRPSLLKHTYLLSVLDNKGSTIRDPIGQTTADYADVFEKIDRCICRLESWLDVPSVARSTR